MTTELRRPEDRATLARALEAAYSMGRAGYGPPLGGRPFEALTSRAAAAAAVALESLDRAGHYRTTIHGATYGACPFDPYDLELLERWEQGARDRAAALAPVCTACGRPLDSSHLEAGD